MMNQRECFEMVHAAAKIAKADEASIIDIAIEYNVTKKAFECTLEYADRAVTAFIGIGLFSTEMRSTLIMDVFDILIESHFKKTLNDLNTAV